MFLPPGFAYIYFIYGNHYCLNISCMEEGIGAAILIRALEPISPKMLRLSGPGIICAQLMIDRSLDGVDMLTSSSPLHLKRGRIRKNEEIRSLPRVGITKAAHLRWRFILARN